MTEGYGGIQVGYSNASTPSDLAGKFLNYGYSGGRGFGAGFDAAAGTGTAGQSILQVTLTGPYAVGGRSHGLTSTFTEVTPICGTY